MVFSDKVNQQLMAQTSEGVLITLATILFPATKTESAYTWHICNNTVDVTYLGVTYKAFPFTFTPPAITENGSGQTQISICVIDQTFSEAIMKLTDAPILTLRTIINLNDNTADQLDIWDFEMCNLTWDALTLTADLLYETYLDYEIPSQSFDMVSCVGCY